VSAGAPLVVLTPQAQQLLEQATQLRVATRARLTSDLRAATEAHQHIRQQSPQLTYGKQLPHWTIVHAYDPTMAPIMQGKRHCPTQLGRKTGILSEPTTGFILATRVPEGQPSDPSDVLPLLAKVHAATERVRPSRRLQVHAVAGDLGGKDSALRQALHARGMRTVGIPKTVEPVHQAPSPEEILDILNAAG
jgi:hypothetical protein